LIISCNSFPLNRFPKSTTIQVKTFLIPVCLPNPSGLEIPEPKCSHSPLRNQAQIFTPFIPRGCLAFLTCTEWIWNSWAESVLFLVLHGLAAALRSERKVRLLIKTLHRNTDDWNAEDAQISSSPEPHQGPDPQAPSRSNKI
jgi:hypothetical protein